MDLNANFDEIKVSTQGVDNHFMKKPKCVAIKMVKAQKMRRIKKKNKKISLSLMFSKHLLLMKLSANANNRWVATLFTPQKIPASASKETTLFSFESERSLVYFLIFVNKQTFEEQI